MTAQTNLQEKLQQDVASSTATIASLETCSYEQFIKIVKSFLVKYDDYIQDFADAGNETASYYFDLAYKTIEPYAKLDEKSVTPSIRKRVIGIIKLYTENLKSYIVEPKLDVVKFQGTKISTCVDPDGEIWVGINPICEAIGLLPNHAIVSIKKHPSLGAKIRERVLLDSKKRRFPMQCLPIKYLHGWLFMINENKVNENARPKLIAFKEQCYDVLHNHFFGKYKVYEANLVQKRLLTGKIAELQEQVSHLQSQIKGYKKQLLEINELEITGQLQLNVGGK